MSVFLFVVRAAVAVFFFRIARSVTADSTVSPSRAYGRALAGAAVLALIHGGSYGSHIEDSDPLYGGGTRVTDFEPTGTERTQQALVAFMIVSGLGCAGVAAGLSKRNSGRR